MHIQSIRLRDWKAFVDASVEFPRPTKRKNVVLIGAMNGYGKTSLLEGLILGLFGRDGLSVLARAVARDGASDKLSYDAFLERAIHARAIAQGRTSTSVEVTLRDEDDVLTIQRIWHFSGAGRHRREDEEVRIYSGDDRDLVRVPKIEDREDFLRSFVAQHFLPVHLSQFFLFDGEQVQRLAQRDMSAQVKAGIEGMLGVPVLRELCRDLNAYAQTRRNSVRSVGDETLERLRAEVRDAESKLKVVDDQLSEVAPGIGPLRLRRDQLVKDLGSFHGGNYANLRELMETKGRLDRERDREKERLAQLLREDLALAIAGKSLRTALHGRLLGEDERGRWENGKTQSAGGLGKLLTALGPAIPAEPPLTPGQQASVEERIRYAWDFVWHPPPAACADGYRHTHLSASDRVLVLERLFRVETMGLSTLQEILEHIDELEKELRRTDGQIAKQHGASDKMDSITTELDRLNQELAEKEALARELVRQVEGLKADLHTKKPGLAKLLEGYQTAQPALRRAARADAIADIIEGVIEECYPIHIDEVGREMTTAFQAMAHKTLVKSVKIEPDCTVKLLGDAGRDMRGMDASAGENQIFALSLIAAIGLASKREFPIFMDTPLARLDSQHRQRVLKYFTEKVGEQVILLSQPDEVHGPYLDAIRDRVAAAYRVDHVELGDGVGQSRIQKGYFEKV